MNHKKCVVCPLVAFICGLAFGLIGMSIFYEITLHDKIIIDPQKIELQEEREEKEYV